MHAVRQRDSTRKGLHFQMTHTKTDDQSSKSSSSILLNVAALVLNSSWGKPMLRCCRGRTLHTLTAVEESTDCKNSTKSKRSPITTLGEWELGSFVPISKIITLGGGSWEKRSSNSRANQGTVNPTTPWNDTGSVRIKLKSRAGRRLNLHCKSEGTLFTKDDPQKEHLREEKPWYKLGKERASSKLMIISPNGTKL